MRKLISISILFVFFFGSIVAQDNKKDFKQFYKSYKDKEGVTSISIPSVLKSFLKDEFNEADDIVKKTKSLKILTTENPDKKMISDLDVYFPEDRYPLLMLVKDGEESVSVVAKANADTFEEILFIIKEPSSLTVMCMKGKYDLDDAMDIGNNINIE